MTIVNSADEACQGIMNANRTIEMGVAVAKDEPVPVNLELGPGQRWFVARALTHQEQPGAIQSFIGWASEASLPRLRRTVRHACKLRDTLNPLFPGYNLHCHRSLQTTLA